MLPQVIGVLAAVVSVARGADPVALHWLENDTRQPVAGETAAKEVGQAVSFGVPWPKATYQKGQHFELKGGAGKPLPLQSWPLAYWPDGSLKWSGFATVAGAGPFTLAAAENAPPAAAGITVNETEQAIDIDTGGMKCHVLRQGEWLFDTLTIGSRTVASHARVECLLQKGAEVDAFHPAPREAYSSAVKKVTVEQSGPVRAVLKIEGVEKAVGGAREWLPFTVRLYFYPGATPVGMVYSFVYDGDQKVDFIRALGITFTVPLKEELYNRHVRFGGEEGGLWAEPVEPLTGNGAVTAAGVGNVYARQIEGARIPNRDQLNARSQQLVDALAKWDTFRQVQPNADGFTVEKRTGDEVSWVPAGAGKRASGYAFAGDVSGGLGVGVQHFWQEYPASLEVAHARSEASDLHVWLWSPDSGSAMDMRHYDTVAHGLNESYEDVEIPLATAYGVGHTTRMTLFPSDGVPTKQESSRDAALAAQPPLLVASPQYLHEVKAFGIWSLQDRSTPYKKNLEDQLDACVAFYEKAVDQYNWYGFWHFGNIMHSYDSTRQTWRYDVGGYAWDNSEQGPDMFLWYSFLRTGRADIFRLAEAMTRCTGETIFYHMGPLAGLGSRHNVVPWGDGAKEARISMAPYRRFYYYLTTDERTGDIMHETLQAETAITQIDPMRKVLPPTEADKAFPARIRGGPDWFAFVGNWMTEWERTGDTKYRDKIYAGFDSIAAMPYWFKTSQDLLWGFDPKTGKLFPRDNRPGGYNLVNNMGGPEVMMELNEFVDHPLWKKIWLQYCRLQNANNAELLTRDKETGNEAADAQYGGGGRMSGYVYYETKNAAYAQRAIGGIRGGLGAAGQFEAYTHYQGPDVLKPLDVPTGLNGLVTNNANQNALQIIEVLELCKDQLPTEAPAAAPAGARGGFGRGRGAGGRGAGGRGGRGPATQP
jgi:hypothetical protein